MSTRRAASKKAVRLAPIAPREQQRRLSSDAGMPHTPLTDLPKNVAARSRSGCLTCRDRKVKCDESRPFCQQCSRLNKVCDYNARLQFKDETPKIVDKYLGSRHASEQWDPTTELSASHFHPSRRSEDSLPPFTCLSNEDDWQKKAEHRRPGTFFVVANSSSFEDSDSYRNVGDDVSVQSGETGEASLSNVSVGSDTLILGTIEEPARKNPSMISTGISRSGTCTPSVTSPIPASFTQSMNFLRVSPSEVESRSTVEEMSPLESPRWAQTRLGYHYRTIVRRHLLHTHGIETALANGFEDAFEREAKDFPPLHDALMALSALSLGYQDGSKNVPALQHCDQAVSALKNLRSERGLASTGLFLTHFILLLYEIASADTATSWLPHMSSLIQIIQERRRILEEEPYPYVIWWICMIDINALLSGSGSGDLIKALMQSDMVPTVDEMQDSPPFINPGTFQTRENPDTMATAWVLQREISIVAARIGLAAKEMHEVASRRQGRLDRELVGQWQQQASHLRNLLKQTWNTNLEQRLKAGANSGTLSEGIRGLFDYAHLTFHLAIIYTHTLTFPSQPLHSPPSSYEPSISAILATVTSIADSNHFQSRFAILPLLLAGATTTSTAERVKAGRLMEAFERESVGGNTRATRELLEAVWGEQRRRMEMGDGLEGVNCVGVMKTRGERVVHWGW